jgi:hypothetical protein
VSIVLFDGAFIMAMLSMELPEKAKAKGMPPTRSGLGIATLCLEVHLAFWLLAALAAYWDQGHNTDFIKGSVLLLFPAISVWVAICCFLFVLSTALWRFAKGQTHANQHTGLKLFAYGTCVLLANFGCAFIFNPYMFNLFAGLVTCVGMWP